MEKFPDCMGAMGTARKIPRSPTQCGAVLQRSMNCGVGLHHEGSIPLQHMPTTHSTELGKVTIPQGLSVYYVEFNSHRVALCRALVK